MLGRLPACLAGMAGSVLLLGMSASAQITVLSDPSASPNPGPVGAAVAFQVSAQEAAGQPLTYSWDFGDGGPATQPLADPKAVHVYAAPGRFAVLVRIQAGEMRKTLSFFLLAHVPLAEKRPSASSTVLVDGGRKRIWAVNPDNHSVACLDAISLERLFEAPVGRHPRTLAQAPDGTLWVANEDDATLSVLDPQTGGLLKTIALAWGSRPFGLAFASDGAGYATLQGTGKLARLDAAARSVVGETAVGADARALAVTPDARRILVTRFISPADRGEVVEVDASTLKAAGVLVLAEDKTPDAENHGRGVPNHLNALAITPDGGLAWVPAKKDNIRRGLARDGQALTFQNTVRSMAARLDLGLNREDLSARLDFDDSEGPAAAAFGPFGFPVFLAFRGSNKVLVWDPYSNSRLAALPDVGMAPEGLAVDSASGRLYVQNFLSRTVSVFDVEGLITGRESEARELKRISTVEQERLPEAVLRGKRIFYNATDPRMSKDGYLSCAACHLDGGSDRRVWDFTDRGEGLRKTASLLGRAGTGQGPVHWSANFDEIQDFEHDMRGPFGGAGFLADADFNSGTRNRTLGDKKAGLSADLDALAAYVASLDLVHPSPHRNPDGSMTAEALEGKKLFERADVGCALCHVPPRYTDSRLPEGNIPQPNYPGDFVTAEGFLLHDVGTLKATSGKRLNDTLHGLDTPTLKGLWETSPYLHDGSAATLMDVLTTANSQDRHGHTSQLTDGERAQLLAFLLQLDEDGTGPAGIVPVRPRRGDLRLNVTRGPAGQWRLELLWPSSRPFPRISLHGMSGRALRMVDAREAGAMAGRAVWLWDGRDAQGRPLPAAVYQLRACSGGACRAAPLPWVGN